jgi:hypothetical protein
MKVWMGWGDAELTGYSIAPRLLFAILAETPDRELLPFEKLYVALNSNVSAHQGYLTAVYKACGCLDKLEEITGIRRTSRELGDLAWLNGDYDEAERQYSASKSKLHPHHNGPHDDRLLKLAFARGQWDLVIRRFATTSFNKGFSEGCICCGVFETAALPYLELLAIALNQLNHDVPDGVQLILDHIFGLTRRRFQALRRTPKYSDPAIIERIRKRCVPRAKQTNPISVEDALARGNTVRANEVLRYLRDCDALVNEAQAVLEAYGSSGDEGYLQKFVEIVTRTGVTSVSHSFLFSAMGHDSFNPADAPPERMARLYGCHPIMNKRHFGDLLDIKFKNELVITGQDILTGLFQQRGALNAVLNPASIPDFFDIRKLSYIRDWAALRLDDWLQKTGSEKLSNVTAVWREGKAKPVSNVFGGQVLRPPDTPRNMVEWLELLNTAARWLEARWKQEIGVTTWISENQLYQILKRSLKRFRVVQHAQPIWLAPQHLDIFIPELSVAIEYMGRQHYEPIEFFGGDVGFKALQERDERKKQLCSTHDIYLHFVRYDEDIGKRAKEISALHHLGQGILA